MEKEHTRVLSGEQTAVPVDGCRGDAALTRAVLQEGIRVIGAKAFAGCSALQSLWLPASLTHIDMKAFDGCTGLRDIYYAGTAAQWAAMEISPQGSGPLTAARLHCAAGLPQPAAGSSPQQIQSAADSLPLEPLPPLRDTGGALLAGVRQLLAAGGDGRLHLVFPDLCLDDVLTKPGDLCLLVFPQGSTMLIDTAAPKNLPKALAFLQTVGLRTLDILAFTHADGDHVDNAQAIADRLYRSGGGIRRLLWTGQQYGPTLPAFLDWLRAQGCRMEEDVCAGRRYTVEGVQITVLGPTPQEMLRDAADGQIRNDQSLILRFDFGRASFLCAGDLYADQEQIVIDRCGGALRADVTKTNHHGCFTSNTDAWLQAVAPRIAVTCSNDNGSTDLAQRLAARGTAYYSIGCHGAVHVVLEAAGTCAVTTQYDRGLRCIRRVQERMLCRADLPVQ